jgi:hypothetical protein
MTRPPALLAQMLKEVVPRLVSELHVAVCELRNDLRTGVRLVACCYRTCVCL